MVIEEVPLTLIVDDAVMVCPASVGLLGHDKSLVLVGSHGVLAHCVAEHFCLLPDVRVG